MERYPGLKIKRTAWNVANYLVDINTVFVKDPTKWKEISKNFKKTIYDFITENNFNQNKKIIFETGESYALGVLQQICLKTKVPTNSFPLNIKIEVHSDFIRVKKENGVEEVLPVPLEVI